MRGNSSRFLTIATEPISRLVYGVLCHCRLATNAHVSRRPSVHLIDDVQETHCWSSFTAYCLRDMSLHERHVSVPCTVYGLQSSVQEKSNRGRAQGNNSNTTCPVHTCFCKDTRPECYCMGIVSRSVAGALTVRMCAALQPHQR